MEGRWVNLGADMGEGGKTSAVVLLLPVALLFVSPVATETVRGARIVPAFQFGFLSASGRQRVNFQAKKSENVWVSSNSKWVQFCLPMLDGHSFRDCSQASTIGS